MKVQQLQDCWRIDDHWWTEAPTCRMYYEVLLEGGRVTTIYHDRVADTWHHQQYGHPTPARAQGIAPGDA